MPERLECAFRGLLPMTQASTKGGLKRSPSAAFSLSQGFHGGITERQKDKTPSCFRNWGFRNLILTMTYSHMGKPHTTIGDASFHC